MELDPYLIIITSLLIFLCFFLLEIRKVTRSSSGRNLPPGPWRLPFIGNLHQLAMTAKLPHHVLRDLAKSYRPVMLLRAGQTDLVVITSREAAKEVMKMQDSNFANRPLTSAADVFMYGGKDVAFSNGPYWRQLRRICITELLISKRVKSFYSVRQEEISSMLKSIAIVAGNKSVVNLSAKAYELSNSIVLRAAFGGMCRDREMFLEIIGEVMELFSGFNLSDLFPSLSWLDLKTRRRLRRLHRKMDAILEGIVQEHLKRKQQQQKKEGDDQEINYDLADVLLNIKERNDLEMPITMDNVKAVILDIFSAGTETSSTTITWAMTELIRHPKIMAKAQQEIRKAAGNKNPSTNYLKLIIKETLRLHPAAPLLVPRLCKETCHVLGHTVPSSAHVIVNAWALGRNPNYWNNPEEFSPERFDFEACGVDYKGQSFEFVPFGAGRRICPGIEFGVAVVEEALERLLLCFDWELPVGMEKEDVDVTETFGLVAAKKVPLCLVPVLRVPLPDV